MTALRLRSIAITCGHRGRFAPEIAQYYAVLLGRWHGWETGCSVETPCGCIYLFRDRAALLSAAERRGWDLSGAVQPATSAGARVH